MGVHLYPPSRVCVCVQLLKVSFPSVVLIQGIKLRSSDSGRNLYLLRHLVVQIPELSRTICSVSSVILCALRLQL